MQRHLKYITFGAFTLICIQYWVLAVISTWLTCDDSSAVEDFIHNHRLIGCLAALIWGADHYFYGRYLVVFAFAGIFALVARKRQTQPPS